ncbi:MAG: hypothetical protein ACD_3C00109G0008 [uncultured bacterium (gcode 4)]|uniref:Uncharacterized protein n=1 Tax=uncultured bacterium (gcode 4) TaxID=1234023 RepID=K2GCT3_9BACT|nr:MAG: hypothetical protein ACD_3C00109G0008 [uncultured bacterium (gcode 4)]
MTAQNLDDIIWLLWKDFNTIAEELWHSPDSAREVIKSAIEWNRIKASGVIDAPLPAPANERIPIESASVDSLLDALKTEFELNNGVIIVEFMETDFTPDGVPFWKVKLSDMCILPFYWKQILSNSTIAYCDHIKFSESWYVYGAVWMKDWGVIPFKISNKVKYCIPVVWSVQINNCEDLEIMPNGILKWKISDKKDWKWYEFEWAEIIGRVLKSSNIIFRDKHSIAKELKGKYWIDVDKSDLKVAYMLYNCPLYWTIRPVKWGKYPYVWGEMFREVEWHRIEHIHSIEQKHNYFICTISIYWWGDRETIIIKERWKYVIYLNKSINLI